MSSHFRKQVSSRTSVKATFGSAAIGRSKRERMARIDSLNRIDFLELDEQDELISLYNDVNYDSTKNYITLVMIISLVETPIFSKIRVFGLYSLNSLLVIFMAMINLKYLNYYALKELDIKIKKELEPEEINIFVRFINLFNENDWPQRIYNSIQLLLTLVNAWAFIAVEDKLANYSSFFLLLPVINSMLCFLIKFWIEDVSNDVKNLKTLRYNKKNV